MKLFGLIEQVHIESIFPVEPISVSHRDLFKRLEDFEANKNLSVGIQMDSTERIVKIPPLEFHGQEVFFELYDYFSNLGRKVHFLESREHFERLAELAKKAQKIQKRINDGGNVKELKLEDYKLEVEFKYQQAIGINDVILRNIALHQPDLVFVGEGHANWFYLHRDEIMKKYGISIEQYWADVLERGIKYDDLLFAASASDENISMENILKDKCAAVTKEINVKQMVSPELETLLIQRNYDAVNNGRVTQGNPHFIGTWDLLLEPRGLFELYIDEHLSRRNGSVQFEGIIEDCIGSASVKGELSKGSITFTKKYFKGLRCSSQPIFYEAQISQGNVVGVYHIQDSPSGHVGFKMKQLREVA